MSSRNKKHRHKQSGGSACSAHFGSAVLQSIRQHARGTPNIEICGVLIGRQSDSGTFVIGAVPGEGAAQGGAHVTFTQEAWVRIHEEKDRRYPGQAIVGWYHSHPGFGVFLSDHDIFIHKNFFTNPGSLAWVYDPHSDEEGCYGWNEGEVRRLDRFEVVTDANKRRGQQGKPSEIMHSNGTASLSMFAFLRYPRIFRAVLLITIAAFLALTIGLGWLVLRDSPWIHRAGEWFNQRHSNCPVGQSPAGRQRARESDSLKKAGPDSVASHDALSRNDNNDSKRDGGHDE